MPASTSTRTEKRYCANQTTPQGIFERSLRVTRRELEKLWRHYETNPDDLKRTNWYKDQANKMKNVRRCAA